MEGLQVTFLALHVLPWDGRADYDATLPPYTLSFDVLEDIFPFLDEMGPIELSKLVARILGTLTAENYDDLTQELLVGCPFSNMSTVCQKHPDALRDTVAMFFSAVVEQKISARLCARLCRDIVTHWKEGDLSFGSQFHRQLLDKCKEEFDAPILDLLPYSTCLLYFDLLRKRNLAYMRFVSELYHHAGTLYSGCSRVPSARQQSSHRDGMVFLGDR